MGNCFGTGSVKREVGGNRGSKEGGGEGGFVGGNGSEKKMRIKLVLTKEELEWMVLQLKDKSQGKKLEDVLEEIGRGRGKLADAWKPSLDSIMESPEAPDERER